MSVFVDKTYNLAEYRKCETIFKQFSLIEKIILEIHSIKAGRLAFDDLILVIQGVKNFLPKSSRREIEDILSGMLKHGFLKISGAYSNTNPLIDAIAVRSAVENSRMETFLRILVRISPNYFPANPYESYLAMRNSFFLQNEAEFDELAENYFAFLKKDKFFFSDPVEEYFHNPFVPEWYSGLELKWQMKLSELFFSRSILFLRPFNDFFEFLIEGYKSNKLTLTAEAKSKALTNLIFRAKQAQADELAMMGAHQLPEVAAVLRLIHGYFPQALKLYKESSLSFLLHSKTSEFDFSIFPILLYPVCMFKSESSEDKLESINACTLAAKKIKKFKNYFLLLKDFLTAKIDNSSMELIVSERLMVQYNSPLEEFFCWLVFYWARGPKSESRFALNDTILRRASDSGYFWIVSQMCYLQEIISGKQPRFSEQQKIVYEQPRYPLTALFQADEPWVVQLRKIRDIIPKTAETTKPSRIVWYISPGDESFSYSYITLSVKEQKRKLNGSWTSGKQIPINNYVSSRHEFPSHYTDQDKKAFSALAERDGFFYFSQQESNASAISQLVNHPLVFNGNIPELKLDVVREQPYLVIEKNDDNLTLFPRPENRKSSKRIVRFDSPSKVVVCEFTEPQLKLWATIGEKAIFPLSASDQLLQTASEISTVVSVHSDLDSSSFSDAETVECDKRLRVLLKPQGEGLWVKFAFRPFGDSGAYLRPGEGGREIFFDDSGKKLHVSRDLKWEKAYVKSIIDEFPMLECLEHSSFEEVFDQPEDAYEMMLFLEGKKDEIQIEWPAGKKFGQVFSASFESLKLKLRSENEWFSVDGELKVSEDLVLSYSNLLELLENSRGRFIPLSDGKFLALSKELKQKLVDLQAISEEKAGQTKVHRLAALSLSDILSDVPNVHFSDEWRKTISLFREASDKLFKLPTTLQAELRDYQLDAFQWLCRMAHCQVGACLADDMGLGKTIEALALILHRAEEGPTLVVAPTSVTINWLSEVTRFAPTLNPTIFGPGDRKAQIEALKPFDLLICSYDLLQREIDLIQPVKWSTLILDEAQAVKNMTTQRSQAVMTLQSDFRMIMTGTPIENHLGELWNLFRFINPGLLGSWDSFCQKYAVPIQKFESKPALYRLKKLVQFFILRRTKSQVLLELPSRTEMTLQVELSDREAALYEAMRINAMNKLSKDASIAGHKHIQILAELMKLRRLCCNPKLIDHETTIPSSKLSILEDLITELLENKHKALIFSQFVDHLSIVREMLEKKGITYQYLDGSTLSKERKKAVDSFQAGIGDFFLISLKAGGVGLNLTAADYVIHLDPWWNPAVENQASDRAHRIGQTRPVTIYRLITKNTIEEKIVKLHQKKKDLADGLLDGSGIGSKISVEELMDLLR
ncbi:MAG: DEAD/DEAH box helicase [Candidatus Riflebacteria bacterium]|nr:DEAD/DEAH box helicase [Candidatus Riflebacteria bacterium]